MLGVSLLEEFLHLLDVALMRELILFTSFQCWVWMLGSAIIFGTFGNGLTAVTLLAGFPVDVLALDIDVVLPRIL